MEFIDEASLKRAMESPAEMAKEKLLQLKNLVKNPDIVNICSKRLIEVNEQNSAWMHKIKEELKLVADRREVQVDDLINAYKTNVFCNVGIQKELREQLAESQKLQRAEEELLNQGEKPQKWFTMERLKKDPIIQNRGNIQLGGEARLAGNIANKAAKVANVGKE